MMVNADPERTPYEPDAIYALTEELRRTWQEHFCAFSSESAAARQLVNEAFDAYRRQRRERRSRGADPSADAGAASPNSPEEWLAGVMGTRVPTPAEVRTNVEAYQWRRMLTAIHELNPDFGHDPAGIDAFNLGYLVADVTAALKITALDEAALEQTFALARDALEWRKLVAVLDAHDLHPDDCEEPGFEVADMVLLCGAYHPLADFGGEAAAGPDPEKEANP